MSEGPILLAPGRYDAVFDRVRVRDRHLVVDVSVLRPEPSSAEFVLAQQTVIDVSAIGAPPLPGPRFDRVRLAILVALGRRW